MPTAAEDFFADLGRRGYEPLLKRVDGRLRFDVGTSHRTKRWLVSIDHGDLAVSHENRPADCAVQVDSATLEDIITGKDNAIAATLRGAVIFEGNVELLLLFQRLLPGPQAQPAAPIGTGATR